MISVVQRNDIEFTHLRTQFSAMTLNLRIWERLNLKVLHSTDKANRPQKLTNKISGNIGRTGIIKARRKCYQTEHIFKFKHHLFMVKPHCCTATTVSCKHTSPNQFHKSNTTQFQHKRHRYFKDNTLHGSEQTTQVQQQLQWPVAYWPPRRRRTRWRVDSFWIL